MGPGFYGGPAHSIEPAPRGDPPFDPYNPRPVLPDLALLLALLLGFNWFDGADVLRAPDAFPSVVGTAAVSLVAAVLARLGADRTQRRMSEGGIEAALPGSRAPMLLPLVAWLATCLAFRWDGFVAATVPSDWFILPHLVFFLPLAVTTSAAWIAVDRGESAMLGRPASPRRALASGLRRNALVLAPVALVLVIQRTVLSLDAAGVPGVGRLLSAFRAYPDLGYATMTLGVAALVALAPAIVRRTLRAVPLPESATRTAITRLLTRLEVPVRDVLLWPTEGRLQNALTVGVFARHRYVIVSDGLLAEFPLPELLAVVAHEAGHVRGRHLLLHGVALISLVLVFVASGALLAPWLPPASETTLALLVLWFGWFGLVGRLSRRFELESDLFAAEHAMDATPDAEAPREPARLTAAATHTLGALKRAARVGGGTFRHGSAELRLANVMSWATVPGVREAASGARRRLRAGLVALGVAALGLTALRMPASLAHGGARLRFEDAVAEARAGDAARRRGDSASVESDRRSRALFDDVVRVADSRPDDPEMARLAAIAEYNAADRAARGLADPVGARRGFERTLERCAALPEEALASLRFATLVDLGRLALHTAADAAAGVGEARRRLSSASSLRGLEPGDRFQRERLRLLEASIALRSPDPAEADRARRDLTVQASGGPVDDDSWRELADDARAELARATAR